MVGHAPQCLAAEYPRREVTEGECQKRGDELCLGLSEREVVERGLRGRERAGGVRHVVGETLIGVHPAAVTELTDCGVDYLVRPVNEFARGGQ
jgi:hypothetical protein